MQAAIEELLNQSTHPEVDIYIKGGARFFGTVESLDDGVITFAVVLRPELPAYTGPTKTAHILLSEIAAVC